MAKNREPEKAVESSDEASSEEVGSLDSDSETEQTQATKKPSSSTAAALKKTHTVSSSKTQRQRLSSSSSDEKDSGSESESDSDGPDPNVRPIASKPMDDPQKSNNRMRKLRSKPIDSDLVTPTKSAAAKRPAEEKEAEAKDSKKAKKKPEPEPDPENSEKKSNDDSKKFLFQRLWSEDDEIVILKGMLDYETKKKSDPIADLNAFHDFIKKNLHVDVTRTQLQDKIRRLRKKYTNNKKKEKEGKDRTFSKSHEQKAYELSKKIWGTDNVLENGGEKMIGSPKTNGTEVEEVKDEKNVEASNGVREKLLPASGPHSNGGRVEESILRIGADLFAVGRGVEGEKEWKKLKLEEMELHLRQLEVRTAQVKLVLDTLKSTDH